MGVEYIKWLIPKERSYRPSADQVSNLANALRNERWAPETGAPGQSSQVVEMLPGSVGPMTKKPLRELTVIDGMFNPDWVRSHSSEELLLRWNVFDAKKAKVRFPMNFDPYPDSEGSQYFDLKVVLGHEYFYWTGENVNPFNEKETRCSCGKQLAYDTGWHAGMPAQRIAHHCPRCGKHFDTNSIACDVVDGWTGEPHKLVGGLTFRFAVVADCGKYWPSNEEQFNRYDLHPDLLQLWETNLGIPFDLVTTAN